MLCIKMSQIHKGYKSTIEEDSGELLLANVNQRNSIALRVEEKTLFAKLKILLKKRKLPCKLN